MEKRIGIAALVAVLAASPATAGTLATSAVFSGNGDDVVCMLSNVSAKPLTGVAVSVKGATGGTPAATLSSTDCTPTLAAGASCFLNRTLSGADRVRCEFSFAGAARRARGSMVLDDGSRVFVLDAR